MKKITYYFKITLFAVFIFCAVDCTVYGDAVNYNNFGKSLINYTDADSYYYPIEAKKSILDLIKPSPVEGTIVLQAAKHSSYYDESGRTGVYSVGDKVEILQDRGAKWYRVKKNNEDSSWWIKAETLSIPEDVPSDKTRLTVDELESYVNLSNFQSETDYLIFTDISRQLTHVFTGSNGNWNLLKTMICATGKNISPTTRGEFKISERGNKFYSQRLSSGARYWVRFNDTYLYHSVAMDKNQNVVDGVLGEKRSMGCIRLSIEDALWFYNSIPEKSCVVIY